MKKLLLPAFLLISQFGCEQNSASVQKEIGEALVQVQPTADGYYTYRTVESNYKLVHVTLPLRSSSNEYIAKFRTETKAEVSAEGADRTIEVTLSPLSDLSEKAFSTKQECDEIRLERKHYKTIKYGCCADLNRIKLFDYHNHEIIAGLDRVINVNIPNSSLGFYMAFDDSSSDSNTLGRVTISYGSGQRYHINIMSDKPLSEFTCPRVNPELSILSQNKQNRFYDNDSYMLWSLDKLKLISGINGVSVKVSFPCDSSIKPITIPIVNGLPFGKDQKEQFLSLSRNKG